MKEFFFIFFSIVSSALVLVFVLVCLMDYDWSDQIVGEGNDCDGLKMSYVMRQEPYIYAIIFVLFFV